MADVDGRFLEPQHVPFYRPRDLRIQARKNLVADDHRRIKAKCAGQQDACSLAARQVTAVVSHHHVRVELSQPDLAEHRPQSRLRHLLVQRQVVAQRPAEDEPDLVHGREQREVCLRHDRFNVDPVQEHCTGQSRGRQPQSLQNSGLPGPGGAYDQDFLALREREIDRGEDDLLLGRLFSRSLLSPLNSPRTPRTSPIPQIRPPELQPLEPSHRHFAPDHRLHPERLSEGLQHIFDSAHFRHEQAEALQGPGNLAHGHHHDHDLAHGNANTPPDQHAADHEDQDAAEHQAGVDRVGFGRLNIHPVIRLLHRPRMRQETHIAARLHLVLPDHFEPLNALAHVIRVALQRRRLAVLLGLDGLARALRRAPEEDEHQHRHDQDQRVDGRHQHHARRHLEDHRDQLDQILDILRLVAVEVVGQIRKHLPDLVLLQVEDVLAQHVVDVPFFGLHHAARAVITHEIDLQDFDGQSRRHRPEDHECGPEEAVHVFGQSQVDQTPGLVGGDAINGARQGENEG